MRAFWSTVEVWVSSASSLYQPELRARVAWMLFHMWLLLLLMIGEVGIQRFA